MPILDRFGRPVDMAALKKEIAGPSLSGVRQVLSGHPAQGMTPQTLATLLRSAEYGNPEQYLALAEEMEEKDLHYRSVLGTRKLTAAGLPVVIEAASDAAEDVKAADLVREVLAIEEIEDSFADVLDAIGKGFSVCEILWDTSEKEWRPRNIVWRDPRWFAIDPADGRTPLLREDRQVTGIPLAPYKFIVHMPRIKSGIPLRGGLARAAAWAYLFKNYTLKDWVAFAEVYGQPIRVGKYGAGATPEDRDVLLTAVSAIGSDAAAIIPDSMMIEFVDNVGKASSAQIYERLLDYLDKQVSKAVLGHTGSADSTPGKLGSEDQAKDVRQDLLIADGKQLAATLNRDLVRPVVDLNLGPRRRYPRVRLQVEEAEDLTALASNISTLVPMGLQVEESWVRDKFNIPEPAKDARLLAPAYAPPPPEEELPAEAPPAPASAGVCPICRGAHARGSGRQNVSDAYAARAGAESLPVMDDLIEPVRKLVAGANSLEEVRDGLIALCRGMDPADLGTLMMQAMGAAQLAGRFEVKSGG